MNAWLSLDFIGKRYGKLPSEILESGSSVDLQIAHFAASYESWLSKKHRDKADGKISNDLSQDEMLDMLNRVRNKQNGI